MEGEGRKGREEWRGEREKEKVKRNEVKRHSDLLIVEKAPLKGSPQRGQAGLPSPLPP